MTIFSSRRSDDELRDWGNCINKYHKERAKLYIWSLIGFSGFNFWLICINIFNFNIPYWTLPSQWWFNLAFNHWWHSQCWRRPSTISKNHEDRAKRDPSYVYLHCIVKVDDQFRQKSQGAGKATLWSLIGTSGSISGWGCINTFLYGAWKLKDQF